MTRARKTQWLTAIAMTALAGWMLKIFLLDSSPLPLTFSYPLDLDHLRTVAGERDLPLRVNTVRIADGAFPEYVVVAGGGRAGVAVTWQTFQIVYADKTVIIDPAHDEARHKAFKFAGPYHQEGWDAMQAALAKASLILATAEQWDHLAGVTASPNVATLLPHLLLNHKQLDNATLLEQGGLGAEMRGKVQSLTYEGAHAVAPGLVLLPAPGHTQGSQMIYVRLQSGAELLFVGDVVWTTLNLDRRASHSRLVANLSGEDRERMADQTRALVDLREHGAVHLVIAHDGAQTDKLIAAGIVGREFE
ncbi:MAG: hypothetical protein HY899_06350 [Deltaproteobacteria bacterium]|nr:hypothetical protein [Deltaproteobacteria bacterium]